MKWKYNLNGRDYIVYDIHVSDIRESTVQVGDVLFWKNEAAKGDVLFTVKEINPESIYLVASVTPEKGSVTKITNDGYYVVRHFDSVIPLCYCSYPTKDELKSYLSQDIGI